MNSDTDQNPRLERYLSTLERVLKPFPVGDRAEIVTEIRSHILSALEKNEKHDLGEVLAALGEPEIVANRYLMERGLKPTKPSFHPVLKWLVLGFLGSFALLLLFIGGLVYHFTPLIRMDDMRNSVSFLGGTIQMDKEDSKNFFQEIIDQEGFRSSHHLEGKASLSPQQKIKLHFNSGRIELSTAASSELSWSCDVADSKKKIINISPEILNSEVVLDLTKVKGLHCAMALPEKSHIEVLGQNGNLQVQEPRFHLHADITNGRVEIEPDVDQKTNYKISVDNGKSDSFVSANDPDALQIEVHVTNGKIIHSD